MDALLLPPPSPQQALYTSIHLNSRNWYENYRIQVSTNSDNLNARALFVIDEPEKGHCVYHIRVVKPEIHFPFPGGNP